MKNAIIVVVALALILMSGVGIVSHLREQRQQAAPASAQNTAFDNSTRPSNQSRRGQRERQDPAAREALRLVGVDAQAEEYWLKAVNNPNLPAKEREDLIEDLNEVGYSDPKHLTAADLPLILKRIAIVEKLEAMDEANAAAIKEAHKDLTNMRDRLQAANPAQ